MSLLLLNNDSFRHVVDYLDVIDLSRLECVCLGTKEIVESYGCWETVAKRDLKMSPRQLESSRSLSLKHRVVRWTLTSRYAAKIESSQCEEKGPAAAGPLTLSQGVNAWEADTFKDPDPHRHQHDYFLRLSDGDKCIWEGFVPLVPFPDHYFYHFLDHFQPHYQDHYHDYGLDLGTLWEEEGFDWYKEVRKTCERDPAFQTDQKLNGKNREGNSIVDQTVDREALSRDLYDLMGFLFKNKCFTFVAVERDLPLTGQFIPKVLVATKGIDRFSYGSTLCYMTEQEVEPTENYEYTSRLMTCCIPESFIFTFYQDYDYNFESYGDAYPTRLDDHMNRLEEESQGLSQYQQGEEEQVKKSDEISINQSHDDDDDVVLPKRALTVYKQRAKNKLARKNSDMRRKRQEPHKKNMRRQTERGELIAFGMLH